MLKVYTPEIEQLEPENDGLEDDIPFQGVFSGSMLIFRGVTDSGLHLEPHDQLKGAEGIKDYTQGVPSIHPSSIQKKHLVRCLFLGPSNIPIQNRCHYIMTPTQPWRECCHSWEIPQKYHSFASSLGSKKTSKFAWFLQNTRKKNQLLVFSWYCLARLGFSEPPEVQKSQFLGHHFPEAPRNNAHPRQTAGLYRGLLKPLVFP